MSKFVSVGKILNFHGIKGEAKVGYSKNQQDFLASLKAVFVLFQNDYISLKIKYVKFSGKFAIIKFDGIDSLNDIATYKNCLLFVEEQTIRENLDEDEFLIDELVGMNVLSIDTEENIGVVVGVSNNGASDLLSIKTPSQKISLVPFVKDIVPVVDIKSKTVKINNISGLLE